MSTPSANVEGCALREAADALDMVAFAEDSNLLLTAARILRAMESGDLAAATVTLMHYRTRFTTETPR